MRRRRFAGDNRTPEEIRGHYEIEKELASRLRNSTATERASLYTSLYDELFQKVPSHPQLQNITSPAARAARANRSLKLIRRFLRDDRVVLEIGAGDCAFSTAAASYAKKVYALDVSEEVIKSRALPGNVEFILSDGTSVDLDDETVDIAYSNQLMEHLHPDDALQQLRNVYHVLRKGGRYFCITPNRLTGPHDVSGYFDDIATGFHLKEYTNLELRDILLQAGFRSVYSYVGKSGIYIRFPLKLKIAVEHVLKAFPGAIRQYAVRLVPIRLLLRIVIVGVK